MRDTKKKWSYYYYTLAIPVIKLPGRSMGRMGTGITTSTTTTTTEYSYANYSTYCCEVSCYYKKKNEKNWAEPRLTAQKYYYGNGCLPLRLTLHKEQTSFRSPDDVSNVEW